MLLDFSNTKSRIGIRFTILFLLLLTGLTTAAAVSGQEGSSFDEAVSVSEGDTSGTIAAGESDFYELEANSTDAINVRLHTDSYDALAYTIYDRNREAISSDGYVRRETARLTKKLPRTGTYYIEVTGVDADTTANYTLTANIITPQENDEFAPNDEFESAVSIGEDTINPKIWGGESDFYKLQANTTDAIDIQVSSEIELLFSVYNQNREEIGGEYVSQGNPSQVTKKLASNGTFYIEVYPYSGSSTGNYTLNSNIITPEENDNFAPNDGFNSAAVIKEKFTDATIWGGESDFYRLEANTTDALDIRLTPESAELALTIYNQNRASIVSDGYIDSGDTGRAVKKLDSTGVYYIEVAPYGGTPTSDYTLNTEVITPQQNDNFAPNDGFESAAIINDEFSDAKIWGGESDFYRVGLTAGERWTTRLTPQNADMEFRIFAPNQTELAADTFVRDTNELSIVASRTGSYYLEVTTEGSEATTSYTVQSDQTGDSNSPPTARFTTDPITPEVAESITFNASESEDPDGSIRTYDWDFNENGSVDISSQTATTKYTYDTEGNYTVRLTVTDNRGATDSTTRKVNISSTNKEATSVPSGLDGTLTVKQFNAIDDNSDGVPQLSELVTANLERIENGGAIETPTENTVSISLAELVETNLWRINNT